MSACPWPGPGCPVTALATETLSLEDIFLQLTEGENAAGQPENEQKPEDEAQPTAEEQGEEKRGMIAIYKRELKSFYSGMMGYLLDAFFILVGGLYFTAVNLQGGYSYFTYTLYNTCFVFLIFVPVLTMRSFAEERHNKTDQLLLTSPVSLGRIVWGKYLALMTVFALPLLVLSVCPLLLKMGGDFSNLSNYSAIFGYFLLGAACIAIGMFISSLTENQIIAVLGTFAILLLTYLMSGIRTLFTTGSSLALIVFAVLLLVVSLLVGLNSNEPQPGLYGFCDRRRGAAGALQSQECRPHQCLLRPAGLPVAL